MSNNSVFNNLEKGMGGKDFMNTKEMYVTGYWYIIWTRLPDFLGDDFNSIMRFSNKGLTLPDVTLSFAEANVGFAGAGKVSVPTTIDVGTEFTLKFQEYSGLPVIKGIRKWVQAIRDPFTGTSKIKNYSWQQYTGECLAVLTKPVFGDAASPDELIEDAFLFTRCMPSNVPNSALNQDSTASDLVAPDINFKFSAMFNCESTIEYAKSKLEELKVVNTKACDYNLPLS